MIVKTGWGYKRKVPLILKGKEGVAGTRKNCMLCCHRDEEGSLWMSIGFLVQSKYLLWRWYKLREMYHVYLYMVASIFFTIQFPLKVTKHHEVPFLPGGLTLFYSKCVAPQSPTQNSCSRPWVAGWPILELSRGKIKCFPDSTAALRCPLKADSEVDSWSNPGHDLPRLNLMIPLWNPSSMDSSLIPVVYSPLCGLPQRFVSFVGSTLQIVQASFKISV